MVPCYWSHSSLARGGRALSVLFLAMLTPLPVRGQVQPVSGATVIAIPAQVAHLDIIDLGIELQFLAEEASGFRILGAVEPRQVLAWYTGPDQTHEILRFEAETGVIRSRSRVAVESLSSQRVRRTSVQLLGSQGIAVLDGDGLRVLDLDGSLVRSFDLPFMPSAILGSTGSSVFLSPLPGPGPESPLFYRLDLSTGEVTGTGDHRQGDGGHREPVTHLVPVSDSIVWIVGRDEVHLELWDLTTNQVTRMLHGHPMVNRYLPGAYARFHVTEAHLVQDRFLWLFIRLDRNALQTTDPEAGTGRSESEFDGLAEVIDLDQGILVASSFLPRTSEQLAGWVRNSIGYRRGEDGRIGLIHCGFSGI